MGYAPAGFSADRDVAQEAEVVAVVIEGAGAAFSAPVRGQRGPYANYNAQQYRYNGHNQHPATIC